MLELRLGHLDRATALGHRAAALPELLAAPEQELVFTRLFVGFLSWLAGDLDGAAAVARAAAAAGTRLRRGELEAAAHWLAGLTALGREDVVGAEDELTRCLDRLAGVDPLVPPFFPGASVCISPMAAGAGWVPAFEETALLGLRVGARQGNGYVLSALGSVHRLALRPAAALGPVRAAVATFDSLGDPAGLALALNHLGCVERDLGSPDAVGHLAEALRLREEIGDRRGVTLSLANLGLAEAAAGDSDRGRGVGPSGPGPGGGHRRPAGRGGHPASISPSSSSSRVRPGPPGRWPRARSTCSARRGTGAWTPCCSRSPPSWPPSRATRRRPGGTRRTRSGCSPGWATNPASSVRPPCSRTSLRTAKALLSRHS